MSRPDLPKMKRWEKRGGGGEFEFTPRFTREIPTPPSPPAFEMTMEGFARRMFGSPWVEFETGKPAQPARAPSGHSLIEVVAGRREVAQRLLP